MALSNQTTPQQFIELIARMKTMDEFGEEFDTADCAETLDELIASARQMLQTPPQSNGCRLVAVQWRECGDEEDSLTCEFLGADEADHDLADGIATEHSLRRQDADDDEGVMFVINENQWSDGEIAIREDGRKFRISIEEIKG